MTLQDIVNDFNDLCMYEILRESKKRYKIYDYSLNYWFIASKKSWHELIFDYIEDSLEEFLQNDLQSQEAATLEDVAKQFQSLAILQKDIQEGATPHA